MNWSVAIRRATAVLAVGGCIAATVTVASCGSRGGDKDAAARLGPAGAALEATPVHRIASGVKATTAGDAAAHDPATVAAEVPPAPRAYAVAPFARIERRAIGHLRRLRAAERRNAGLTATERSKARLAAVRDLSEAVLAAAGLDHARFEVMDGGSTVEITLDRKAACQLRQDESRALERQITAAGNTVMHVSLRVAGSTLSIDRYLKRKCTVPTIPALTDKVIYNTTSSGIAEVPVVIRGRRWKIDWQSSSSLLQIYVFRDGKLQSLAVNHEGRGAALRVLKGPGRFRLRIAGTGAWSVRVLDVARPARQGATRRHK